MAHPNVTLVVDALRAGGADPARIERLLVLPDAVSTAAAAAAALGVEVGQIANSLVFAADGAPLLVDPVSGAPVGVQAIPLHLRRTRLTRTSLEANGGVCRGMLAVRYPEVAQ